MYKNDIYEILENKLLAKEVYRMILKGETKYIKAPGQFINLKINGCYLRRPISISDYDENTITIIYKIFGKGTEIMSKMNSGEKIDILTGLGNGFDTSLSGQIPLLIAGGVGVPPMYRLCKELIKDGNPHVIVIGQTTCSHCIAIKPALNSIAGDYDLVINYININTFTQEQYDSFSDSLKEIEYNDPDFVNDGSFGTPLIFIIKDNKVSSYIAGERSKSQLVREFTKSGLISE